MIHIFSIIKGRRLKKKLRENHKVRIAWFVDMKSKFTKRPRIISLSNLMAPIIGIFSGAGLGLIFGTVGVVGIGAAFALPLFVPFAIIGGVFAYAANKLVFDLRRPDNSTSMPVFEDNLSDRVAPNRYLFLSDNETHRDFMQTAIRGAQLYVVIRSAFISPNVINEAFLADIKAALLRGVTIYLEWGYRGISTKQSFNEETAINTLKDFTYSLTPNLRNFLRLIQSPTHVKEISVDNRLASSGSFNWLSNASLGKLRNKERSLVLFDERISVEILNDAIAAWNAWPFRFGKAINAINKG